MNVNVWGVAELIQELVRSESVVDPVKLTDPGVALEEMGQIAA